MAIPASGALAVELHRHSPTHWIATYYPMVTTPAGRWAEVTWDLHHVLMTIPFAPRAPARWLEACSPDPDRPCYVGHRPWAPHLATGYATARAVYDTEAIQEPLVVEEAQLLREGTFVVPVGQLAEWVLEDLQDETSEIRG